MMEIRVGKLADALGVHRNTVRNWIRSGALEAIPALGKKYAIEPDELTRFLRSKGLQSDRITGLVENISSNGDARLSLFQNNPLTLQKEVSMSDKPVGSVLMVGGGVAGIQASLDLADSGYYVYLLEKSPGIGGAMSQLDKTFPTNDCAM
jgi:excisionase family DNA binding protein